MKSMVKMFLLAITVMAFCSNTLYAQNNPNKQRMTREQLAEVQARHIAEKMAMDDATSKRFVETYCQYQQEMWAAKPKKNEQKHPDTPSMTEEETAQLLKARFDRSQQLLDLRKKYYGKYSEFMTQKQIKRLYELEKQMQKRLSGNKKKGDNKQRNRR